MNSWYQAMLLKMAAGQYLNLSRRLTTQYDWLALWGLMQEQRVSDEQVRP